MEQFNVEQTLLPIPEYEYITNSEDMGRVITEILKYPEVEFDTETTGFDPYTKKIVLAQLGVAGKAYVIDVRHDTEHSSVHIDQLKPVLQNPKIKKLIQNAVFDMKMIKHHGGYYIDNIYDTMLVEQLFNLGISARGAGLADLVYKYLGLKMTKQPATTFKDYGQKFKPFQLEYAAGDVVVLSLIKSLQEPRIIKEGFEDVCRLEFEFTKAICEMELNGITIDTDKWRIIMSDIEEERIAVYNEINSILSESHGQNVLFGVPVINIDSPKQLLTSLSNYGLKLENSDQASLSKYKGVPVIDKLLKYRKLNKLISTYAEPLLDKINPVTGRLHTRFKQMVSTGRMSSSNPNLQNIPKKQKYRSCFIAKEGYSLITSDMSSAELRIMGNLSLDPVFIECLNQGKDLHSRSASEVFNVDIKDVDKKMRNSCKAISFGLMYGLSKYGLSERLKISEKEAEKLINNYFNVFKSVKTFLDKAAKDAVRNGYTTTIAGRKRFYNVPPFGHPDRKRAQKAIERQAKNAGIQGCVVFDSKIKGIGNIGEQVGKRLVIDTGFGEDTCLGVSSGIKEVYNLKLSNGITTGITLDHKIPTINKLNTEEVCKDTAVSDLTINDLVMIPLNISKGNSTILNDYKYKDNMVFKKLIVPKVMTKELAFIIGCIIGNDNGFNNDYFGFVYPQHQKDLVDKFNENIEKVFGYSPIKHYECINNIKEFLKYIGIKFVTNYNKEIPDYFYTETITNRGALLNGLFSTNGNFNNKFGINFIATSKKLIIMVQQLLLSLGIVSNLNEYIANERMVYKLQIPRRFNTKFNKYVGFSVNSKQEALNNSYDISKFDDDSIVPCFIPITIEKIFRRDSNFFNNLTTQEKEALYMFKKGKCSFTSWRVFYNKLPECTEKVMLSKYLKFDFCNIKSLNYLGKKPTYDLMCDNIHYFISNGIILHNSNADTIKQTMINVVNRLENSNLDARLLLTVHDEIIVEVKNNQIDEVSKLVESSMIDGFGRYFTKIGMETDVLVGPTWLKSSCDKCNCTKMKLIDDIKYGTKLVCSNCGEPQE